VANDQSREVERLTNRMDLMDQRLDNIDTMVTAVAERIMSQPISFIITCPHCHKNIEVAMLGTEKFTK
jgi:hypothetical protein